MKLLILEDTFMYIKKVFFFLHYVYKLTNSKGISPNQTKKNTKRKSDFNMNTSPTRRKLPSWMK